MLQAAVEWIENAAPWPQVLDARRVTLVVQDEGGHGAKLLAWVPVYRRPTRREAVETPVGGGVVALAVPRQETTVSPALVWWLVEYGLREGWRPSTAGPEFVVPEDVVRAAVGETIGTRLRALITTLGERVGSDRVESLMGYLDVGERGLTLEFLCEYLGEDEGTLSRDVVDKILSLVCELGLDERYTRGLLERGSRAG